MGAPLLADVIRETAPVSDRLPGRSGRPADAGSWCAMRALHVTAILSRLRFSDESGARTGRRPNGGVCSAQSWTTEQLLTKHMT